MKIKNFIKRNLLSISMLIIGISIGAIIMSMFIPDRIATLENGEMPIVTIDNNQITADEYYSNLKDITSIEYLLDKIDTKILDQKYETTLEIKKQVQATMNETKKEYIDYYNCTETEFLTNNGFNTEEDFYNYMLLEHKRKLYLEEYVYSNIKDSEINNYYIKNLINDFEIKYISGKESVLEKVLVDLESMSYDEVIKKYQKQITYKDYSYVSFDNNINEDIYNEAFELEENSYTKTLVSINNVYYIIFKGDIKEKDDVKVLKDRIKKKITDEKISNDIYNELYYKALDNLRSEANLIFNDTVFKEQYDDYLSLYK